MAHELRVLFKTAGEAHLELDAARTTVPFDFALEETDYDDLRWYLEEYLDLPDGGSVVRARRVEGRLDGWGRGLYDALFGSAKAGKLIERLLGAGRDGAGRDGSGLLTVATEDPDLLRLPWELLADERGPLSRQGITVRRQLEQTEPGDGGRRVELPLRLLVIVSRPAGLGFIDPRLTTPAMLDALEPLGAQVTVDFCRPPTVARMEKMLTDADDRGEPYHAVHFEGHGTFLPEIGLGALCFESSREGETDYARADRLGTILAGYRVPLVILEACRTSMHGKVHAFRSVAPRLVKSGVGSVLAMSHSVHVEATRLLLTRFYGELAAGKTLGQALERGRAALIAEPYRWIERGPRGRRIKLRDWFLPTLYQHGEDLTLVPAGALARLTERAAATVAGDGKRFDVFLSYNHADGERVESFARELRDHYGLRVFFDRWEIPHGSLRGRVLAGAEGSRFLLKVVSKASLASKWVGYEHDVFHAIDPRQGKVIPLILADVDLPADVRAVKWYDFRDPGRDLERLAELAEAIGSRAVAAEQVASARRQPPERGETGAFPRPPLYRFHGRAAELYALERELRRHRAVLLHAMGGMGKTALAREAAYWWTRTGLFPDGACFLSFEQPVTAERIALVLGTCLEGHAFEALPAAEQLERASQLFDARRVLMVWDNFESVLPAFQDDGGAALYSDDERGRIEELFRDWSESPEGKGRLLVTCRPDEAGLLGVRRMELRGLARPDALHLLAGVLEKHDLDLEDPRFERDDMEELLALLGDHPLSIELVAPHLKKMTPGQIVADFSKLLAEFRSDRAEVERNRSLLASLEFSASRLGEAAQAALPWLGLFRGGVFEDVLLDVSELEAEVWEAARQELEATALIRVERDLLFGDRPYLRFHPTLAYRAAGSAPASEEVRRRFVAVYLEVNGAVAQALRGSSPRGGLEVMQREEANFRAAVDKALEAKSYAEASSMGATFRDYLERSGRLRERDAWVARLADEVGKGGFSAAVAARERDAAWALFTRGNASEAVARLEALLERLRGAEDFDPAFDIAYTQTFLGRVFYSSGNSVRALPVLAESVRGWEALVAAAVERGETAEAERANLSMTLGDLANASMGAGRLDEALAASERAVGIRRELGHDRDAAAGLGQSAQILAQQGRFGDADVRYREALDAARRVADRELEGAALQSWGSLADDRGRYAEAAERYRHALKLFQEMNDEGSVMRTCTLLGVVEQNAGRLAEARSWYERSRAIAERREDRKELAGTARNLGIVLQLEAEAARQEGDHRLAKQRLKEAASSMQDSVRAFESLSDNPNTSASHGQLAQIYLLLGDLDRAEDHAHRAREIFERLGLKEAHMVYHLLADIARARGDATAAAEWEAKRDDLRAELRRRAGGPAGLPAEVVQAIVGLTMACVRTRVDGSDLPPQAEALLAQLGSAPAPLDGLVPFLRAVAAGEEASVPEGLPEELRQAVAGIVAAGSE